jgi:membrane protein DedA with SNARE-associated domain
MTLEQFLSQYGLIALFLLATVEGDASLILAGMLAHRGVLSLPAVIVAGAAGNFVGDCAWYFLGRQARARLRETAIYRRAGPWIERVASRLGSWQLLLARVVYGTRNASMVFWGQAHLPFQRFALTDLLGCFLASTGFALLGYLTSQGVEHLLGQVRRLEVGLLITLVVAAVVIAFMTWEVKRASDKTDPPETGPAGGG